MGTNPLPFPPVGSTREPNRNKCPVALRKERRGAGRALLLWFVTRRWPSWLGCPAEPLARLKAGQAGVWWPAGNLECGLGGAPAREPFDVEHQPSQHAHVPVDFLAVDRGRIVDAVKIEKGDAGLSGQLRERAGRSVDNVA